MCTQHGHTMNLLEGEAKPVRDWRGPVGGPDSTRYGTETFLENRPLGISTDSGLRTQRPLRDALDEPRPDDGAGIGEGGQADRRLPSDATGGGRSTRLGERPNTERCRLDVPHRGESLRRHAPGGTVPV